jgi:hypothetical protein
LQYILISPFNCEHSSKEDNKNLLVTISADSRLRGELRPQARVHRVDHGHGRLKPTADHASHPRNTQLAGENTCARGQFFKRIFAPTGKFCA